MGNQLTTLKGYLNNDTVKKRFQESLGDKTKSNAFISSVLTTVTNSNYLQKATPESIMNSALIAASLDLPIDQNLGFAAIVPYGKEAQFQIMYRGFIQLAIRTGQYKKMHVTEVYADEIDYYNPITGELDFKHHSVYAMRDGQKEEDVCGFYASFVLNSGFEKSIYIPRSIMLAHAKKYSKMYQSDLNYKKKSSKWSTDFVAMGKKTAIKQLLSKWGILSTDMQKAVTSDQKVYGDNQEGAYADNPENSTEEPSVVIDAEATDVKETPPPVDSSPVVEVMPDQVELDF